LKNRGIVDGVIYLESDKHGLYDEQTIYKIIEQRKDELSLILLGGVNYYTGQALPMQKITFLGRERVIVRPLIIGHNRWI
jgi:kynureninase